MAYIWNKRIDSIVDPTHYWIETGIHDQVLSRTEIKNGEIISSTDFDQFLSWVRMYAPHLSELRYKAEWYKILH